MDTQTLKFTSKKTWIEVGQLILDSGDYSEAEDNHESDKYLKAVYDWIMQFIPKRERDTDITEEFIPQLEEALFNSRLFRYGKNCLIKTDINNKRFPSKDKCRITVERLIGDSPDIFIE